MRYLPATKVLIQPLSSKMSHTLNINLNKAPLHLLTVRHLILRYEACVQEFIFLALKHTVEFVKPEKTYLKISDATFFLYSFSLESVSYHGFLGRFVQYVLQTQWTWRSAVGIR